MLRFEVSWLDSVVPFRVEIVAGNVEAFHFGVADLDALHIGARIEREATFNPLLVVVAPISAMMET